LFLWLGEEIGVSLDMVSDISNGVGGGSRSVKVGSWTKVAIFLMATSNASPCWVWARYEVLPRVSMVGESVFWRP
jgi:hypothetical protein